MPRSIRQLVTGLLQEPLIMEPEIKSFRCKDLPGLELKKVVGGIFDMGGYDGWQDPSWKEKRKHLMNLRHPVQVSDFYVSEFISWDMWARVLGCTRQGPRQLGPSVTDMTHVEIMESFLPALNRLTGINFRLISEAEWEFAVQSGQLDVKANETEWCHDYFGIEFYDRCLKIGLVKDPLGPSTSDYPIHKDKSRVIRWLFKPYHDEVPDPRYRGWHWENESGRYGYRKRFRVVYPLGTNSQPLQNIEPVVRKPRFNFVVVDINDQEIGVAILKEEAECKFLERHPHFDKKSIDPFIYTIAEWEKLIPK